MKKFKLIDSRKTIANSLVMGCKIYKTKYDCMFLSEIDFITGKSLKEKDILQLVYLNGLHSDFVMFSIEMLKDSDLMNKEIDYYYKKFKK